MRAGSQVRPEVLRSTDGKKVSSPPRSGRRVGGAGGGWIPGARAETAGAELVAPEFGARKRLSVCSSALGPVSRRGRGDQGPGKMVVLRSSLELHSPSATPASSSLDLSNEFLSLEQIGRRRLRSARATEQSAVTAAAAGVSTGLGRAPWAEPEGLLAARSPGGA